MVGSSELDSDNDGAVFREGHFDAHKRVESSARRPGELPERLLHALSLRLDPDSSRLQSCELISVFLEKFMHFNAKLQAKQKTASISQRIQFFNYFYFSGLDNFRVRLFCLRFDRKAVPEYE